MAAAENIMARFKRLGKGNPAKGARVDIAQDRKAARTMQAPRKGFGGR